MNDELSSLAPATRARWVGGKRIGWTCGAGNRSSGPGKYGRVPLAVQSTCKPKPRFPY